LKKLSMVLASFLTVLATPAFALLSSEQGDTAGYSIATVPYSEVVPGLDLTPGVVNQKKLPSVVVICGQMCRAQGVVIFHPNGNDKIFVGGSGPNAVDPTTNGGNDTPEQQEEKKKQCLANCAVQDTVNKNNCTIANAQFAAKLTTVPLWTAVTGGFAPLLLTKNPLIAGGGAIGGAALGYLDVQMRVKDQLSFCLAVAARDNNDCIKNTCHAWMLPLALLPLRRRYNEKVKEAQA